MVFHKIDWVEFNIPQTCKQLYDIYIYKFIYVEAHEKLASAIKIPQQENLMQGIKNWLQTTGE